MIKISFNFWLFLAFEGWEHHSAQNHQVFGRFQVPESIDFQLAAVPSSAAKSAVSLPPSYWKAGIFHQVQSNAGSYNLQDQESSFLGKDNTTLVKSVTAVERFLLLCFELGVVEVSAASDHVNRFVFPWAWEFFHPQVILLVWYEILVGRWVQFLGQAVFSLIEQARVVFIWLSVSGQAAGVAYICFRQFANKSSSLLFVNLCAFLSLLPQNYDFAQYFPGEGFLTFWPSKNLDLSPYPKPVFLLVTEDGKLQLMVLVQPLRLWNLFDLEKLQWYLAVELLAWCLRIWTGVSCMPVIFIIFIYDSSSQRKVEERLGWVVFKATFRSGISKQPLL